MTGVTRMTKGLDLVFVKNLTFFHDFIFGKMSQQNVLDVILESTKCFKTIKKQKVKKVEESGFFQRSWSMGLVKKLKFSIFVF